VFQFRSACLFLLDEAGLPELRCAHGAQTGGSSPDYSHSMVEAVVNERKPLLVHDTRHLDAPWESARLKGIRSAVAVPMMRDEEILGVIYLDQGDSSQPFNRRHLEELQILANLAAAKLHHCQSRIEMHAAAQIQRHMLRDRPMGPARFDVATRLQPCKLVGGDFYETLCLPGGRYLYALGDVAGKGVAAALIMAETLATLRAVAGSHDSPLPLMQELQGMLAERLSPRSFVTLFLGVLDPASRRFEYVNAGHEPGVLLQRGHPVEWLESTAPPVGMQLPVPMESAWTRVPAGGFLGLWSDGITEAIRTQDRAPELFGRERLLQCLEGVQGAPAMDVVAAVFQEIDAFTGDTHAQDDRTFLALQGRAESH
jgi:sigma-B regulation protein RsbU (phosphoserine phosphatase)